MLLAKITKYIRLYSTLKMELYMTYFSYWHYILAISRPAF